MSGTVSSRTLLGARDCWSQITREGFGRRRMLLGLLGAFRSIQVIIIINFLVYLSLFSGTDAALALERINQFVFHTFAGLSRISIAGKKSLEILCHAAAAFHHTTAPSHRCCGHAIIHRAPFVY